MMMSPIGKRRRRRDSRGAFFIGPRRAECGFTFIELVLVIFIVLVLVGLSTPLFRKTFAGLELKDASYRMASAVNYAREMAIMERANYKVNFSFKDGKFWITRLETTAEGTAYRRIGGKYGRVFTLPRGVLITGDHGAAALYPDGRCDEFEVKVADRNGAGFAIHVKGFGGEIEAREITKE